MNYQDLKIVLDHVKKNVNCPHCNASYKEYSLTIAEVFGNGCLVVGTCEKCKQPSLVEVLIFPDPTPINEKQIQITTHKGGPITKKEITEISSFLQEFNGDFKKLFTN